MTYANDGLRFFLELSMLAALAYWGFSEYEGAVQWLLALGSPLVVAVAWGAFLAPKASHPTVDPVRLLLEVAAFGSGLAALPPRAGPCSAWWSPGLVVLHLGLTFALGQRPARPAS